MGIFKTNRLLKIFLVLLFILVLTFPHQILAQEAQDGSSAKESPGKENAEKENPYPKKMKAHRTWEYIVNIPGYILYVPFWLVYTVVNTGIGWIENTNIIPRVRDLLESDDGKRITYPTFESQYGFGLTYKHKDLFKKNCQLKISTMLGLRWRQFHELEISRLQISGPLSLSFGGHYFFLTDAAFYGIGNTSPVEERTNYAFRQSAAFASANWNFSQKFNMSLTFTFEGNKISEGRNPDYPSTTDLVFHSSPSLLGLGDQVNMYSAAFFLRHDSLSRQENTPGGWRMLFNAGFYNQFNGDEFSFLKASADITHHLHLFYSRSLVIRVASEITRPIKGEDIPFYYLSKLGRRTTIRGYFRGRFHDRDSMLVSLEYHYPLIKRPQYLPRIYALLFVDWGKVSPNIFKDKLLGNYHRSLGVGFRIYVRKERNIQFILAKSEDGFRIHFVLNQ